MFREHSSKTNDMDTIEYATFRYDTVKVENGLNNTTIWIHTSLYIDKVSWLYARVI